MCIGMQLLYQGASLGTNVWLNTWSGEELGNSSLPENRDLYLGVYGAFGFVQAISVMILTITLSITTLDASRVSLFPKLMNIFIIHYSFIKLDTPLDLIGHSICQNAKLIIVI